jgi:hypothetical protein
LVTQILNPFGSGRNHPQLKDFAKLGSDACEVIAARTAQGMTGTLSAAEAYRMIAEKQAAVVQAWFTFTKHALNGELNSASASSFEVFRKAVSKNRRRLRRRKSR